MLEERRQFPRLVPSTPLFVSMDDAKSGLLLDLCEGGLAVASLVPRNLDDVFSLAFDLPEGVGHIETKAQVAWTRDSGHLTGVRFMELDEVSQQQLSEWIAAGTNLRPAGSEEVDEPVIVTRSTYAQVDAIRRQVRHETRTGLWPEMQMETPPQVETPSIESKSEESALAGEMAMGTVAEAEPIEPVEQPATAMDESAMEMTGTLFPETREQVEAETEETERPLTARMSFTEMAAEPNAEESPAAETAEAQEIEEAGTKGSVEAKRELEANEEILANPEMGMVEPATTPEAASNAAFIEAAPAIPGSTSRAEWVEHVAQMEDSPLDLRLDAGRQTLPPDAETVGWASDAVGWVQEIAEKRVTAPEEAEFDGVFTPVERTAKRPIKSRHTIELVLAVVLLTWALVFLGYQMGSTGANQATRDLSSPKTVGGTNATTSSKAEPSKAGAPLVAPTTSGEAFPEMSPIPPISAGRRPTPASNSASFETPAPPPSRGSVTATPKTPASAQTETTHLVAETSVLADGTPSMSSGVVLQVGAMKMEGNATALVQDLKKKKFSAFVYRQGNDNLYRVGVGPFGDKDASAKVRSELQKNGYPTITAKWSRDKG